jgi:hypothetical protein
MRKACTDDIEESPDARRPLEIGMGDDPELAFEIRDRLPQCAHDADLA